MFGSSAGRLPANQRILFRRENVGFVFQQFNLLPALTAAENAAVPLIAAGMKRTEAVERAKALLDQLGLNGRRDALPATLSGGEQQRVAIARALVHEPRLVVCDEPTAALDHATGEAVMKLVAANAVHPDRAAVVVTHDSRVFHFADVIAHMDDGRIVQNGEKREEGDSVMKRTVLPIVAAVAAILAMISVARTRPKREPTVPPSAPPTSSFEEVVAGVGLVEANSENIDVSCAVSGMVTQLYVKAGDRVGQGQKLFSLDDRELRADQQVKRTALEGAQARLAKLEQEPRAEDIPPAEERVREAQANSWDAEVQMRLIESVTDKRAVRDEDVQRRRLAYIAAQARLAEVEAQLGLLKAGAWAPDIAVAKSEVAQAEAQVKMAETNIDRLTMRAPIAGVILQNKVRLGQYAQCGPLSEPLMILGSVTPLNVRVDVDEHDAWRVRGGAPAAASPRGNGSIRIPLEFVRFEPYVVPKKSLTGDSTERVDTRVLQVIYRVKDQNASLYVGQQMDVYIKTVDAVNPSRQGPDSAAGRGQ